MALWPSIDDLMRTRQAFENATTKRVVYFLLGMTLLSGIVALVGVVQLNANPNILNQIPEEVVLTITGIIGFAFFFPWFTVIYFSRYFLANLKQLEREIGELRKAIDEESGDIS